MKTGASRRRGIGRRVGALLALVCGLVLLAPERAASPQVARESWTQSDMHVTVLMRALTYDHRLRREAKETLRVGVLFDARDAPSVLASAAVLRLFEAQADRMTFLRRRVVVIAIPLAADDARLERALDLDLDALYLTPGMARNDIVRVTTVTRRLDVISMAAAESYVFLGVSLAAVLKEGRPHILVNYPAGVEEGAEFSTQLLQLAEVIGRKPGATP